MATAQNTVTGIYFKAEETSPRLVTVPLEIKYVENFISGEQVEITTPVLPPLLGPGGRAAYDSLPIATMGWRGPPLEQPFRLFIRDNFLNDGSPRNMIPSGLTNGRAPHRWAGNLLALKQPALESEAWVDCNMDDVETLTRYFEWYGDRELRQQVCVIPPFKLLWDCRMIRICDKDTREGLAQLQALFPSADFLVMDLSGGN